MRFHALSVQGAFMLEPEPRGDERGLFARIWCVEEFAAHGLSAGFEQASVSFNDVKHTLRGMHYQQEPHGEVKLVRCTAGAIFDVVVDMREGSPSYLQWSGETLTAQNRRALYIPKGCAHGFITLEDASEVFYEIAGSYQPEAARGVRYSDPRIGISWPAKPARIAQRDADYPLLSPLPRA
jgi:dTDP-4-dehydrorhamnose 3,5-epimerase